jgi:cytochrome c oxidase assembly protein subunit 16
MPTFQNKTFRSSADANKLGMRYRALMSKHPFLAFGLPFMAVIVAGSFVLTPATAIRYEKHDRKVRQMTKEEELNVRRAARKVDMKEEYYVSCLTSITYPLTCHLSARRRGICRGEDRERNQWAIVLLCVCGWLGG